MGVGEGGLGGGMRFPNFLKNCSKTIVIRNGKMVWKYLGCPYRAHIKKAKNDYFWEELASENDFKAV